MLPTCLPAMLIEDPCNQNNTFLSLQQIAGDWQNRYVELWLNLENHWSELLLSMMLKALPFSCCLNLRSSLYQCFTPPVARPYLTIYCHSVLWEAWSLQPFMIFGCSCTGSTDNLHLLMFPLWSPACDEGEDDAEEREIGRYGNWGWVGSVWAWHALRGGCIGLTLQLWHPW